MDIRHIPRKTFPIAKCQKARVSFLVLISLGLLLVMCGFIVLNVASGHEMLPNSTDIETISAAVLEAHYGVQVRQIHLSTDSSMIDFHLKILDAGKAQQLLSGPDKLPRLIIPDQGLTLFAQPQLDQSLSFRDGEELVLLFGNTGETVKPGTFVIVNFGTLQLERLPVEAEPYYTGSVSPCCPGVVRQLVVAH